LFVLTEFGYKHIDDCDFPVKRSILGMLSLSESMGGLQKIAGHSQKLRGCAN